MELKSVYNLTLSQNYRLLKKHSIFNLKQYNILKGYVILFKAICKSCAVELFDKIRNKHSNTQTFYLCMLEFNSLSST